MSLLETTPVLTPLRTADGSTTLWDPTLEEPYHSRHGAVTESTHVFIRAGLEVMEKSPVDLLEVGLGTGLNLLLTWIRCLEGKCTVNYTALEPYPLSKEQLESLHHCEDLFWPGLHNTFLERMTSTTEAWQEPMGGLRFRKLQLPVLELEAQATTDLVYFDAFGPRAQPEMWTTDVFRQLYRVLRPGGLLVTYCAKADVRRALQAVGFMVERLPGPPGKQQMLRATKASDR
jgi:tRNA U34 5-methylaminomethyl-2-thiouridine-forming methyltransferase MnmC